MHFSPPTAIEILVLQINSEDFYIILEETHNIICALWASIYFHYSVINYFDKGYSEQHKENVFGLKEMFTGSFSFDCKLNLEFSDT
jgi:hypothetical protein